MKPLALNISKMKKVSGDKNSSVFLHPDGHQIKVAHAPLSSLMKKQIEKMPIHKMAEGGDPSDQSQILQDASNLAAIHDSNFQANKENEKAGKIVDPLLDPDNSGTNTYTSNNTQLPDGEVPYSPDVDSSASRSPASSPGGASGDWGSPPPTKQNIKAPAKSPLPADPFATQGLSANAALQTEKNRILGGAAAEGDIAKKSAQAYGDFSNQLDQMLTPQQILQRHQAADQAALQAYASKTIDPDKYLHSRSTGQQISGAIGLLFGGMGAAKTGQPNYALDSINRAISNDIDAQKNDQSKQMNLWQMNRQATQDDTQANLATHNQLLNGVKAKILQYEAQSGGPIAAARAAPQLAQIDQQMAENNFKRALLSSGQVDPTQLVPALVPPDQQKQALTEIGQAKSATQSESAIMRAFDQAAKDTRPATGFSATSLMNTIPYYHPPSIKTLHLLGDPLIHDNEGRVNEFEKNDFNNALPQFGDSDETVATKRNAMQNFINHKKQSPTAMAHGINLERYPQTSSNPMTRMSPQQQQIYQEAKQRMAADPNDPVANAALKRLGVQ